MGGPISFMLSLVEMEYRTLGKTGLRVSVLSLGGSALGGVFGPVAEADAVDAVRTALDVGVNYIDTSPYYAATKAETVLGAALRGVARDRYYLATKVGRYGREEFDFSRKRVTASLEESLSRLGVDYVDVIQCHDIEFGSLDQIVEETIPALRECQRAGKARFVGITGYPLKIFSEVARRCEVDTILSYCRYTLNDRGLESILPEMEAAGVGVIHAAPLAMGLLTEAGPPSWHPAPAELRRACARAAAYCRERGVRIEKLALRMAGANPRIHTVVTGVSSAREVRENAASIAAPVDEALMAAVEEMLAPVANQCWVSGRAENN